MISAQVIADSINPAGNRITSFVVVIPRIVLAEFNTHRAFSRNSASSRAIPFETMLSYVQKSPFIPMKWMLNHKGMQGTDYVTDPDKIEMMNNRWLDGRNAAVDAASKLFATGVTKQICNRMLEPYLMHTIIVTATEWENFFALRAHEAAEIHIAEAARLMLEAYNASKPKSLNEGDWHVPFGDKFDAERLRLTYEKDYEKHKTLEMTRVKIATARCARVSYMNFDGSDDYDKDIDLHDRLATQGHWSPFEHCAMAMGEVTDITKVHHIQSGNFRGWHQYRKSFIGENRRDPRVEK